MMIVLVVRLKIDAMWLCDSNDGGDDEYCDDSSICDGDGEDNTDCDWWWDDYGCNGNDGNGCYVIVLIM